MGILVERKKVIFIDIFPAGSFAKHFYTSRQEPPTLEEQKKNLAIMYMKKKNAEMLDAKHLQSKSQDELSLQRNDASGRAEFPKYDEYEHKGGVEEKKK